MSREEAGAGSERHFLRQRHLSLDLRLHSDVIATMESILL